MVAATPCCTKCDFCVPLQTVAFAVFDLDQRARRSHAGVRLERPFVFGLDHARRGAERLVDIAVLLFDLRLAHWRLADVIVERVLLGKRIGGVRPFDGELFGCLDGVPFAIRHHAEEAALPDDLRALDVLDAGLIDLHRDRARNRRTDHAPMHHAGHLHVGAEVLLREDLRRDVLALDRLADDFVCGVRLRLRLAGCVERIAPLLVPLELDVEVAPADQFGIGRFLVAIERGAHRAIDDDKLVGGRAELFGRHFEQHAARFGRCHAHLLAAELNAGGAGRAALVHRGRGVAHVDRHGLERHVEFLGNNLADRHEQPVAHVHLAEISGHAADRH